MVKVATKPYTLGRADSIALYIHIPWCIRKCPYCDFNSHAIRQPVTSTVQAVSTSLDPELETAYIQRLLNDLGNEISLLERPRKLSSVFVGGGTPSLLSEPAINQLFTGINKVLPLESDTECTVEANPGSSDINCFRAFQRAGVNRLSLGIQSFSDTALKQLGRVHNQAAARKAFAAARSVGFENINVDLMHGLPGQTVDAAMHDLDQAIALNSEHLSWYQLTIEPNTLFYSNKPDLPDEDDLWDIYRSGLEQLEQAGFQRYEISAFKKPGRACRHNLNYWRFGDYVGIGAGAHGKISFQSPLPGIHRTLKTRQPSDYLASPKRLVNLLQENDVMLEFLMNALRLVEGFSLSTFTAATGFSTIDLQPFLNRSKARGLLEFDQQRVKATPMGLRYLDDLLLMI